MMAIVVAFAICVLPKNAVRVFLEFSKNAAGDVKGWATYQYVAYLPYPLHVAINPIIYSVFDPAWRHEAHLLVTPLFSKCCPFSTCRKQKKSVHSPTNASITTVCSFTNRGFEK